MSENLNLFGETETPEKKNTRKTKTKALSNRDKLLKVYREENFSPESKYSTDDDNKNFFSLKEKLKMFRADFPAGTITTKILVDNNIFATVEATVECESGKAVAVGKWYHTNSDVFGKNYLSTAQSVAISSALRFLGYDDNYTAVDEPPLSANGTSDYVESSLPVWEVKTEDVKTEIAEGSKQTIKRPEELTVEQAKTFAIPNHPFNGKSVGEILEDDNADELDQLKDLLSFSVTHNMPLATVGKAILPLLEVEVNA